MSVQHLINGVGRWTLGENSRVDLSQTFSAHSRMKDFGGKLVVPIDCVGYKVWGGEHSFFLYQSLPGLIPLYFYQPTTTSIVYSMSLLAMRVAAKAEGVPFKQIEQARAGVAYRLSARGLQRYVCDQFDLPEYTSLNLKRAGDMLLERLTEAASFLRGEKVLTPISGGTDGLLTAIALKQAGVDQLCVCIGRTEDDFDPKFARKYADQLKLDYEFLTLPESNEELQALLDRTLPRIEMVDFSNVLMGMCNVRLSEVAEANQIMTVVNADLADVALGNDTFTVAAFKKANPDKQTARKWAEWRVKDQLRNLPTNFQVFKAHAKAGQRAVQLFADRPVLDLLLGCSLEVTPADTVKPLYYEVANRFVSDGSWRENNKKVGYYTGSGIGKIRLDNPVLQDENIRRTYQRVTEGAA